VAAIGRRKDGPGWRARVSLPDGRRLSTTWPTRREAEAWAGQQESTLRSGTWLDPAGSRRTVADWHAQWWPTRIGERTTLATAESYLRVHVLPAWGVLQLGQVTRLGLQDWVRRLSTTYSSDTVRGIYGQMSRLMADAVHEGLIVRSPCQDVDLPPVNRGKPRALTMEEQAAIFARLGTGEPLARVAVLTGLRWGEVAGLPSRRVNLLRRELEVVQVMSDVGGRLELKAYPKSRSGRRTVPLTDEAVRLLEPLVARAGVDGLVFGGRDGGWWSRHNYRERYWRPAVIAAGVLPAPTFHDLRDTYITRLVDRGVPLTDVMRLAGHSSVVTTQRYTAMEPGAFDRVRRALEGVPPGQDRSSSSGAQGTPGTMTRR